MLHLANLQPSIPAMKMKKNNSLQIGLYVSVYQNIKVNSKLKNSFLSTMDLYLTWKQAIYCSLVNTIEV